MWASSFNETIRLVSQVATHVFNLYFRLFVEVIGKVMVKHFSYLQVTVSARKSY